MANAWLPVPGWTGEHEWSGFIPFQEMPRIRNPRNGFIVTANNRQVDDDYPYYISVQYAAEHRARRIYDRLAKIPRASADDMAAVHAERVSIPARAYVNLLRCVQPASERAAKARNILLEWDGSMDADAAAPAVFSAFRYCLDDGILRNILGPLADYALNVGGRGAPHHIALLKAQLVRMAQDDDTSFLPPGSDWKSTMAAALEDGVDYLAKRLGNDMNKWTWGAVHRTNRPHWLSNAYAWAAELSGPSMPLGGDGDTPPRIELQPRRPLRHHWHISRTLHLRPERLGRLPMDRSPRILRTPSKSPLRRPIPDLGKRRLHPDDVHLAQDRESCRIGANPYPNPVTT